MWNDLGFEGNIYFRDPLPINNLGSQLLCGRDAELHQVISECFADNKCLKVIGGDVGVGKTSFVNACQFVCYEKGSSDLTNDFDHKILPSYRKIEISNYDNLHSFSIKAILSLTTNINSHFINSGFSIPESIREYVDYWTRIKLQASTAGLTIGANVLGCGGQVGRGSTSHTYQEMRDPLTAFENLRKLILDETDLTGVFMLIDNADIVRESELVRILDEIRDSYFSMEHIYWILVGQKGLSELVSSTSRRLSGYLTGSEIIIDKLTPKMFLTAIEERQKMFRIKDSTRIEKFKEQRRRQAILHKMTQPDIEGKATIKYVDKYANFDIFPPIDESIHLMIYEFTHRELRESFKICSDITIRAQEYIKSIGPLSSDIGMNYLIEYCDATTSFIELKDEHTKILSKIYLDNGTSNTEYKRFGYKSASGFESLLRTISNKGLLLQKESSSGKHYIIGWRLEAMALCNLLDNNCTKKAHDKHFDQLRL